MLLWQHLKVLLLNGEIKSHRCSSQCIFKSLYHNNISGLLPQCDANETGPFCQTLLQECSQHNL